MEDKPGVASGKAFGRSLALMAIAIRDFKLTKKILKSILRNFFSFILAAVSSYSISFVFDMIRLFIFGEAPFSIFPLLTWTTIFAISLIISLGASTKRMIVFIPFAINTALVAIAMEVNSHDIYVALPLALISILILVCNNNKLIGLETSTELSTQEKERTTPDDIETQMIIADWKRQQNAMRDGTNDKIDYKNHFQNGYSSSKLKSHKQAIYRAIIHAIIICVSFYNPLPIIAKIAIFIILLFVFGAIASSNIFKGNI